MSIVDTANIKGSWAFGDAIQDWNIVDATGRGNNGIPNIRITPVTNRFSLGATSVIINNYQFLYGYMACWGKWDRLFTSAENTALAAGEVWPFSTTTSLQDARAYYLLDEASASTTFSDATGRGNTLTLQHGSTTRVSGFPHGGGYACNFGGSSWIGTNSPGTDIQYDRKTHTVAGWVYLSSKPHIAYSQGGIWCSFIDNNNSGLNVAIDTYTLDRFACDFDGGNNAALNTGGIIIDTVLGSPSIGTWYFLKAEVDMAANECRFNINNGTQNYFIHRLQPFPIPGLIGNASQFLLNTQYNFAAKQTGWDTGGVPSPVPGNSFVVIPTNADTSFGNNDKTFWAWIQFDDLTTVQSIAGNYTGTASTTDWGLRISAANTLTVSIGTSVNIYNASVTISDTNRHLVVVWHDKTASKIHIDVDNGWKSANTTYTGTPHTVSTQMRFGSRTSYSSTPYGCADQFQGNLCLANIADGIPVAGDLSTLYNGGAGWAYGSPPSVNGLSRSRTGGRLSRGYDG